MAPPSLRQQTARRTRKRRLKIGGIAVSTVVVGGLGIWAYKWITRKPPPPPTEHGAAIARQVSNLLLLSESVPRSVRNDTRRAHRMARLVIDAYQSGDARYIEITWHLFDLFYVQMQEKMGMPTYPGIVSNTISEAVGLAALTDTPVETMQRFLGDLHWVNPDHYMHAIQLLGDIGYPNIERLKRVPTVLPDEVWKSPTATVAAVFAIANLLGIAYYKDTFKVRTRLGKWWRKGKDTEKTLEQKLEYERRRSEREKQAMFRRLSRSQT